MAGLSVHERGELFRSAAVRRHPEQARYRRGREDDRVPRSPGGSDALHRIADRDHRVPAHSHFLQLPPAKEADPIAVGREERADRPARAGDGRGLQRIERAQEKLAALRILGDVHQPGAVGRDGQPSPQCAAEAECIGRLDRDGEADCRSVRGAKTIAEYEARDRGTSKREPDHQLQIHRVGLTASAAWPACACGAEAAHRQRPGSISAPRPDPSPSASADRDPWSAGD